MQTSGVPKTPSEDVGLAERTFACAPSSESPGDSAAWHCGVIQGRGCIGSNKHCRLPWSHLPSSLPFTEALSALMDLFRSAYYGLVHLLWKVVSWIDYAFEGTHTREVLVVFWDLFRTLWYFVVFGAFVTVCVSRFLPKQKVAEILGARQKSAIVVCSVLGVLSPMSTFSAIPMIGGLLAVGVPAPPLMAFLVASPLINPALFFMTAGALGIHMAVARTLAAFGLGIAAGVATRSLFAGRDLPKLVRPSVAKLTETRSGSPPNGPKTVRAEIPAFVDEYRRLLTFIAKYFLLALVIAGLVETLIPPRWIVSLVGPQSGFSVLIAVAMGVPLYACGGGTIPIIQILTQMGMSQGAALAFFISGPATKISTIVTLNAVVRPRVVALYLAVTLGGAALCGYAYSFVAPKRIPVFNPKEYRLSCALDRVGQNGTQDFRRRPERIARSHRQLVGERSGGRLVRGSLRGANGVSRIRQAATDRATAAEVQSRPFELRSRPSSFQ